MSSVERLQGHHADFWQTTSRYGLIHTAEQGWATNPSSLCLIVYVHGLFGDAETTWGDMPRWVLDSAAVDLDVISFHYPSKFWQRCSIAQAAYDLETWLKTEYAEYRHIIFVTHSTGGLVVKHLLNQGFSSTNSRVELERSSQTSSAQVWTRTRRVINIAVPHRGGTRAMTILSSVVYPLFYCLAAPLLLLVKVLTQGGKDWGRNQIITRLRRKHRRLLHMDHQFHAYWQESKDAGLPTPVVTDICAESDQSVAVSDRSIEPIYVRGTHKSVKIPKRSKGPIVGIVSEIIKRYPTDVSLAIVDKSLTRIQEVNRAASISSLIGIDQSERPQDLYASAKRDSGWITGSQRLVCNRLRESVSQEGAELKQLLLVGSAGVGKSTVMRALAWQLSCCFLSDPRSVPLPLFIPLQQATLSTQSVTAYSWESMWTWWLQWAHSLSAHDTTTIEWLEQKFQNDSVIVIIDGVDDFLVNHPEIGFSTFTEVLHCVLDRYALNNRFKVIVSLRKDTHGLRTLIRNPKAVFEILPLSRTQAIQQFPQSSEWLSSIRDTSVLQQIMTPLVLSHYQPSVDSRSTDQAITQTSILSAVLENYIIESKLAGVWVADSNVAELEHLVTALGIIAWFMFFKSRGDISLDELIQEVGAFKKRLQGFVEESRYSSGSPRLETGYSLLENIQIRITLLKRTIFISTGPDRFRFIHRTWQELLVARFLTDSIKDYGFNELANAKMYSGIYRVAGELYQGESITDTHVKVALDAWRKTGQRYISGNLIGFLSWTTTPIDFQAIQLLLDELENLDELSRSILIGGLGYRLLVNNDKDSARSDIRRCLLPKLKKFSRCSKVRLSDPVVASLAWCYQKAFAVLFGARQPTEISPALGFGYEHTSIVLPIISSTVEDRYSLDDRSRALQRALLTPILDTFNHPMFMIRAVHYLYYLVVAKQYNVLDHVASQELELLLQPGCEFEGLVTAFDSVPELQNLYIRCQKVYDQLENSWSNP